MLLHLTPSLNVCEPSEWSCRFHCTLAINVLLQIKETYYITRVSSVNSFVHLLFSSWIFLSVYVSDVVFGYRPVAFFSSVGSVLLYFVAFLYYSGLNPLQISPWFWRITVIPLWIMLSLSLWLLYAKYVSYAYAGFLENCGKICQENRYLKVCTVT